MGSVSFVDVAAICDVRPSVTVLLSALCKPRDITSKTEHISA